MFRVHLISERAVVDQTPTWLYRAVVERYVTTMTFPFALWYIFDQSWLYESLVEAEKAAVELEALYVES